MITCIATDRIWKQFKTFLLICALESRVSSKNFPAENNNFTPTEVGFSKLAIVPKWNKKVFLFKDKELYPQWDIQAFMKASLRQKHWCSNVMISNKFVSFTNSLINSLQLVIRYLKKLLSYFKSICNQH